MSITINHKNIASNRPLPSHHPGENTNKNT